MQGVQISVVVVRRWAEENDSDSRSHATSVVKRIQYRSSHRQVGPFYAAIALARVARNNGPRFYALVKGGASTEYAGVSALGCAAACEAYVNELRNHPTRDARFGLCVDT